MILCTTVDTPFRYQITQYDCVPTTFSNAISCLYSRKYIPVEVLKALYCYSLDSLNKGGTINGSSIHSIELLAEWLNSFKTPQFNIIAEFRYGPNVDVRDICNCIAEGGVTIAEVQCWRFWHYILIMGMDDNHFYCFDPYHKKRLKEGRTGLEQLTSDGRKPNLRISKSWLKTYRKSRNYCLGRVKERVVILLEKRNK